ncbi:MAG: DNA-3-methyladenine glycosylase I [Actinomycetales bacterium]|nr:DNA-3-methyladenine glycosylase I [Actinomycetales bacterium]
MRLVRDGADGRPRCPWPLAAPDYVDYHDVEWGRAVHGDAPLFERLCLEGFQAGLSWLTILRRRPALRAAFAAFDPAAVAAFDDDDVTRLMADPGIIRNRAKVQAVIGNARALLAMQERQGDGCLDALIWSARPARPGPRPSSLEEIPASTAESARLSAELRQHGFRFVGPITCYAAMQACGVVDDHLAGCFVTSQADGRPG